MNINLTGVDKKKIYLIIAVLILLIIAFLITVIKKNVAKPIQTKLNLPSQYAMLNFTTSDGKNFSYLDNDHLTFYKINFDNQSPVKLMTNSVYYINDVIWSNNANQALIKAQIKPDEPGFIINNFTNSTTKQLDSNTIDASWSNNDNVIYSTVDENDYHFIVLKKDNYDLVEKDYSLKNERCDKIVQFNQESSSLTCLAFQSDIIAYLRIINLKDNSVKQIDGEFATAKTSPDGSKIIALQEGQDNIYWVVLNSQGETQSKISFDTDEYNINKVTWNKDNKTLVIAIRKNNEENDRFYLINAENGNKNELKFDIGGKSIDAVNLLIINNILYFTSDTLLYQFGL